VGFDNEAETLRPDRYYLVDDAGSFFFDPGGDNDGFESPEAAAEWARTQTVWPRPIGATRPARKCVAAGIRRRPPGAAAMRYI
jgi:hypothetical protein